MFKKLKEWFFGKPESFAEAPYKVEAPVVEETKIAIGPEVYVYPLEAAQAATEVGIPEATKKPAKVKKPAAKTAKVEKVAKAPAKKTAAKKPAAPKSK